MFVLKQQRWHHFEVEQDEQALTYIYGLVETIQAGIYCC
jgi:hypothetical protein